MDDQDGLLLAVLLGLAALFGISVGRVVGSVLSWLQSSLLSSISFRMSASFASAAGAASSVGASSLAGGVCAAAESAMATLKPSANSGSLAQPNRDVVVIPSPRIPEPQDAIPVVRNCGNRGYGGQVAAMPGPARQACSRASRRGNPRPARGWQKPAPDAGTTART
ncbi:hypothetical protein MTX20_15010 [Bradyrhizobium sp. ISRA435]|nr:hypothetical protein MTX20_15010 [Bradyrhizobium sp. ISRA435]